MVTGRHKNFHSPLLLSFQAKYGRISTYNIFVGCDDSLSVYWNTICKKDGIVLTINFSGDWPKISRPFFHIFFITKYPTFISSFSFQVCKFVSLIIHGDWTNPDKKVDIYLHKSNCHHVSICHVSM